MSKTTDCGTLRVDKKTLFWVENCLAETNVKPTNISKLPCGNVFYDADKFKLIDGVLTDINSSGVGKVADLCGELLLDTEVFVKNRTIYSFEKAIVVKSAGDATEVTVGDTLQFSVVGQDVTWSIVEEVVDGTSISDEGLLTVDEAETATELTVMATSSVGKTGILKVTVAAAE